MLVEGKIASDRISAFLSEGRAVEYRTLSSAPTTRPPEPHSISRHDGRSIGGRLPARRLEEEEQSRPVLVKLERATFRWDKPPDSILWAPEDMEGAKFGSRDALKRVRERKAALAAERAGAYTLLLLLLLRLFLLRLLRLTTFQN